jgi:hypothetical protein
MIMSKRIVLVSALLSLILAFGCAEIKDVIKDMKTPKEDTKKAKPTTPAETPKEASSQKQPETTTKDSTTTKSTTTSTKKPASGSTTSSESSGAVFGPK